MTLTCPRCSQTSTGAIEQRHFVGPYQDRATSEWIARCVHCGNGQVVEAPEPARIPSRGHLADEIGQVIEAPSPDSEPVPENIIEAEFEELPPVPAVVTAPVLEAVATPLPEQPVAEASVIVAGIREQIDAIKPSIIDDSPRA